MAAAAAAADYGSVQVEPPACTNSVFVKVEQRPLSEQHIL
jgi:hypothetical protein